jgi:hypothetical protein
MPYRVPSRFIQIKSNLPFFINEVAQRYYCRVSKVTYLEDNKLVDIAMPLVLSNLKAIKKAITIARTWGESTLAVSICGNYIDVNPGLVSIGHKLYGEITIGNFVTRNRGKVIGSPYWAEENQERAIFHFFGIEDPFLFRGYPVISQELECLIDAYYKTTIALAIRAQESFGLMIEMGGVNSSGEDAPLLQTRKDEILEQYQKTKEIIMPQGSKIHDHEISLSDFEKVVVPLERAISTESKIPQWLLFPETVSGQYELENRAEWAQTEFENLVLPVLARIFELQGYQVVNIEIPAFRGALNQAEVENKRVDSLYKESATRRNNQQTDNMKKGVNTTGINSGRKL